MKKTKRPQETKPAKAVVRPAPSITWWPWAAAAIALAVTWEIYTPALNAPFLFDDFHLPFFTPNLGERFQDWVGILRPLLNTSFWIDHKIGGSEPYTYHVTNVLLHFITSVITALIVRKILEWAGVAGRMRETLAVFAGALFLLHPLQTESVAYIASRSEVLSVMFYYGAFAVFLYRHDDSITLARAIAVMVLFGAAMATKEHTLTLPVLLVFTDYFWGRGGIRKNWILYALICAAAAVGAKFVWDVLRASNSAGFNMADLSAIAFFFTECRVLWTYIRLFFIPIGQNVDPDIPISHSVFEHGSIVGLIALIGLVAAAWIYRKRFPLASYGVFVFFLLIAPTSTIAPIRDVLAEHRMYLPFLGLILVVCEGLRRLNWNHAVAISAAVLAICSVLTYQRCIVWSGGVALWSDTAAKSPNKYRPRFQLAYAQYQENQCPQAAQNYEVASKLGPAGDELLTDWGLALDCAGQWTEAIEKLRQAAQVHNSAHVHSQIGMVYAQHQQWQPALEELAAAERINPNYEQTYVYRGQIYQIAGDRAAAAREFQRALALNPKNQPARDALAQLGARR